MKRMLFILSLLALPSCGAKPLHVATVADSAIYQVLNDAHSAEQIALCQKPSCAGMTASPIHGWSQAQSTAFNKKFLPAVSGGRQFNLLLGTVKQGQPLPAQVTTFIQSIGDALAQVTADFPPGTAKTTILADIAQAQNIALKAIADYLSLTGGTE